jgi:DnaJ-class molecular chaperone
MESTMANDFYKTLGVNSTASPEEIAKAYRKLARKHHPDLNPDDARAKKRFQEIQTAYDTLNDPEKRKLYDQFGDNYEQFRNGKPFGTEGPDGKSAGFDFGDVFGGGAANSVDFGDFLRRQFGGGGGTTSGRSRRAPTRGQDVAAELEIPLRMMIDGGDCEFRLNRGDNVESIQVKIPAGISPGKKIRLRGQGTPAPKGKPGDLILTIQLQTHPFIKVVGNNLEMKVPISLPEAIQGAKVDIQTPSGEVAITVPPMSSSGKRLRIKGQGLKSESGEVGDMIAELQIKLPERIDPALAAELETWKKSYPSNLRDSIRW